MVVLASFVWSLAPRYAWANDGTSTEASEVAVSEQTPAVETAKEKLVQPAETEPATPKVVEQQSASAEGSMQEIAPAPALQTRSLVTGENKTGVSSQAISVPKGPGTIQGMGESFSAQASTGIATFSVPFALSAARGGAQPSLGLGYSSSSGNGLAGIGWDVGVPYIARQTDRGLPKYRDQGTWHAEQDRFVYNGGQELVPVATLLSGETLPAWPEPGWQYFRPRVEGSYLRFFWNPTMQLWRVQDKAGVVLELGVVGSERDALQADPAEPTHVFRWNLKRQIDARGNEVRYYYAQNGNAGYLTDIYDTAPGLGSSTGTGPSTASWAHHTRLVYEPREDVTHTFTSGWETTRAWRLDGVDVTAKGDDVSAPRELVRRYHLEYATDSHVSLLESVQVEGQCATPIHEQANGALEATSCPRLPPMTFGYTHVGASMSNGFETIDTTVQAIGNSPKHSVDEEYTDLYDVNSDALPDAVAMMPGLYGSNEHGVWYQGEGGTAARFGQQGTMGIARVLGATASVITKHNSNIAVLSDPSVDLDKNFEDNDLQ